MKVAFNTMMKNEARLLESILPIWKELPNRFYLYSMMIILQIPQFL